MTEERVRFTAELTTFGQDMGLRGMSEDEVKEVLSNETNIPIDCIEDVEVR